MTTVGGSPEAAGKKLNAEQELKKGLTDVQHKEQVERTQNILKKLSQEIQKKESAETIKNSVDAAITAMNAVEALPDSVKNQLGDLAERQQMVALLRGLVNNPTANPAETKTLVGLIASMTSERGVLDLLRSGTPDGVEKAMQEQIRKTLGNDNFAQILTKLGMNPDSATKFLFGLLRPMVAMKATTMGLGTQLEGAFARAREIGKGMHKNMLVDSERQKESEKPILEGGVSRARTEAEKKSRFEELKNKSAEEVVEGGAIVISRWDDLYKIWESYASRTKRANSKAVLEPIPTFADARRYPAGTAESSLPAHLRNPEQAQKQLDDAAKVKQEKEAADKAFAQFPADGKINLLEGQPKEFTVNGKTIKFTKTAAEIKLTYNTKDYIINSAADATAVGVNAGSLLLTRPATGGAEKIQVSINGLDATNYPLERFIAECDRVPTGNRITFRPGGIFVTNA